MRAGLLKTTLVNYPGRVASAVFLPGCNLRCPFCHNGELACASVVSGPKADGDNEYITIDEVYAHLEKRKNVLGALAISGGEPFLSPALADLVKKAKELSLSVKIDTNGTLPARLLEFLENPAICPDMLAVDVKTSPARYGELSTEASAGEREGQALLETLALLNRSAPFARAVHVEYRTVLVPGLVDKKELEEIANLIPENADWKLARFMPGNCLDPAWNDRAPYGPMATADLEAYAQSLRPNTRLR